MTDLAVLTRALDDPEIDLETQLHTLITAVEAAIASYLGMTMTIAADGHEVSLTVDAPGATPIATSLVIPLTAVSTAEAGSTLTLYAATPGAFVDLAADLGYALGLPDAAMVLDTDLAPTIGPGFTGLAGQSTTNRAMGVLLDRGHTLESAREELRRLDAGDVGITAEHILRTSPAPRSARDR